ncbi:MAG TPA: Crp/Fnr family transcriptional regulator, partial [Ramlibacter sp.]|nr:Crp/Fnr family transcriptional regulator [Ramlibacter sp.]
MTTESPLYQRRRNPTAAELAGIPWLKVLRPDEYERAVRHLTVGDALPG